MNYIHEKNNKKILNTLKVIPYGRS